MAKITVYNQEGKKTEEMEIIDSVFGLPKNDELLLQVYNSMFANKRRVLAHAKDRGERKGSGKKPWRQKGTGNARAGSVRSPLWRKGGVTFGPTKERNFKKKIPAKMKRKALLTALSEKVKSDSLYLLDNFEMKEKKTKNFFQMLKNLNLKGSALVALAEKEKAIERCARNIEKINVIPARNLNVFEILNSKYLILSKDSVKEIEKTYQKNRTV